MSISARVRPRKSLGQHWLIDRRILTRIVEAAGLRGDDTVLEIGAGTGRLTDLLAERASRVIAVEIDPALVGSLRSRFRHSAGVSVVQADALAVAPEELVGAGGGRLPYVVVGNLPYYAGTAIVRRFLRARARPRAMVVTLQAEVAESMAAAPGRMTYLSLETQLFAEARVLFRIPARAFNPAPKVASAVVRLDVLDSPEVEVDDAEAFLRLAQAGFAAPRKQLRNSLAVGLRVTGGEAGAILDRAGIDGSRRPAALSLDEWRRVYLAARAGAMAG